MEIRDYQASDGPGLLPLYEELGYPTDEESLAKRLDNLLQLPNYHLKLAIINHSIVGFIGFSKLHFFERDGSYYRILALVVSEKYRKQGIATGLIDEVRLKAYQEGVTALALNSGMTSARETAHEFYQHYGFKKSSYGFSLDLDWEK